MKVTAVVPVLNEARALPALLDALAGEVDEIVVVDGGSTDGTAARCGGVRFLQGMRGRGPQMNAGAAVADGDLLWFVHADTRVPPGAGAALRRTLGEWGCFATEVEGRDPRLRWTGWWMTRRAYRTGSCTGDMGIWARRAFFTALGGFAPLAAFEDLEFSDRARARTPACVLRPAIGTSARRWTQEGVSRTLVRMLALRIAYRAGVDPDRLAGHYASSHPRA